MEEGTPFGKWYPAGSSLLPQEEAGAAMYADASRMLRQVAADLCPRALQRDAHRSFSSACTSIGVLIVSGVRAGSGNGLCCWLQLGPRP